MIKTEISNQTKFKNISGDIIHRYGIALAFIAMVIMMSLLSPSFLTIGNIMNVIRQISIIAIVGCGATLIIITTGTDLSPGSVMALVSVISASFAHPGEYPLIVPIVIGLLVGACAGAINGLFVAKGNIPAFIATMGMMTAARGAALLYSDGRPITNFSESFDFIGRGYLFGIPFPIYILVVAATLTHILLKHTKFGKYVYAIGGNKQAAMVSGINVKRYLMYVYIYAGMMTGLAGIVFTSRISAGQPTAALGYELDAIASVVIGGTSLSGGIGSMGGTILGALIIGVLNNGLDLLHVSAYWQQIIKGAIIVGSVLMDQRRNK